VGLIAFIYGPINDANLGIAALLNID